MGVRAVARAETALPPIIMLEITKKLHFPRYLCWRAADPQPRARPFSARRSILLIKKILFDYLIEFNTKIFKNERNCFCENKVSQQLLLTSTCRISSCGTYLSGKTRVFAQKRTNFSLLLLDSLDSKFCHAHNCSLFLVSFHNGLQSK